MSASESCSLSGVMLVLWIRNLSLHLALSGGSSFIACSITRHVDIDVEHDARRIH